MIWETVLGTWGESRIVLYGTVQYQPPSGGLVVLGLADRIVGEGRRAVGLVTRSFLTRRIKYLFGRILGRCTVLVADLQLARLLVRTGKARDVRSRSHYSEVFGPLSCQLVAERVRYSRTRGGFAGPTAA
jgi:hypothetical protein